MGSICRLCLHKNKIEEMKNVFEFTPKYFKINITEILYWIFDVEIIVEDTYSKLICYKCMNVIETVGKCRQFFQVNQTFLHERRCPADFEVKSGWHNTRDIGTNTDFINNSKYVTEPNENVKAIDEKENLLNVGKVNTVMQDRNKTSNPLQQSMCVEKEEWVNVPLDIFKEFSKPGTVKNDNNKTHDRIDVPTHIFKYYSPHVTLPALKKECLNEGIHKVGNKYYKLGNTVPKINIKRIEDDKDLLKKYKRTGKFTFKEISVVTQTKKARSKRRLILDYYYRMPTSALRELITETNNEKLTQELSITSLVKTNEINVHVCEYCSKVFKAKNNLSNHYFKIHRKLLRNKYKKCYQGTKEKRINHSGELNLLQKSTDIDKSDKLHTYTNHIKDKTPNNIKNTKLNCMTQTEEDPLNISLPEPSQGPSGMEIPNNELNSLGGIKFKDVKQVVMFEQSATDDYHIDYLKTVIFGKSLESSPKVSYYSDNSSLKEHDYAHIAETQPYEPRYTAKRSSTMGDLRSPQFKKMNADIANLIKQRFADIKQKREEIEKMRKIRFALYNEIEHCNIKSSIFALEQKLQTAENI